MSQILDIFTKEQVYAGSHVIRYIDTYFSVNPATGCTEIDQALVNENNTMLQKNTDTHVDGGRNKGRV